MKNRTIVILIVALVFANVTNAQKAFNNSVKINMGGFNIKDRHRGFNIDRQLGASYDRQIYKGFGAGITYMQWGYFSWRGGDITPRGGYTIWEPLGFYDTAYGTLHERARFRNIDLNIYYRYQISKRHFVKGGVGPSYHWGINRRIEEKNYDPNLIFYNDTYRLYNEKVGYWGIVQQLSYDYCFIRGYVNIGIDLRSRHYAGLKQVQYDYGFHIGANF